MEVQVAWLLNPFN